MKIKFLLDYAGSDDNKEFVVYEFQNAFLSNIKTKENSFLQFSKEELCQDIIAQQKPKSNINDGDYLGVDNIITDGEKPLQRLILQSFGAGKYNPEFYIVSRDSIDYYADDIFSIYLRLNRNIVIKGKGAVGAGNLFLYKSKPLDKQMFIKTINQFMCDHNFKYCSLEEIRIISPKLNLKTRIDLRSIFSYDITTDSIEIFPYYSQYLTDESNMHRGERAEKTFPKFYFSESKSYNEYRLLYMKNKSASNNYFENKFGKSVARSIYQYYISSNIFEEYSDIVKLLQHKALYSPRTLDKSYKYLNIMNLKPIMIRKDYILFLQNFMGCKIFHENKNNNILKQSVESKIKNIIQLRIKQIIEENKPVICGVTFKKSTIETLADLYIDIYSQSLLDVLILIRRYMNNEYQISFLSTKIYKNNTPNSLLLDLMQNITFLILSIFDFDKVITRYKEYNKKDGFDESKTKVIHNLDDIIIILSERYIDVTINPDKLDDLINSNLS